MGLKTLQTHCYYRIFQEQSTSTVTFQTLFEMKKENAHFSQFVSATKVNGFQCKAIATKSSILHITEVPDPLLITIFGKVIFNVTQETIISFNLIAIYEISFTVIM